MKTFHKAIFKNSKNMREVPSGSVDLVVTSPPYPMIAMWDEMFCSANSKIRQSLDRGDGYSAFELMHRVLDRTWDEMFWALRDGGIACINIGDAVRTLGAGFALYSSHSQILGYCLKLGFSALPAIIWRKQTNAPNKFMGSGMLPPGAYVTLEHEYILVLRKGAKREFATDDEKRNRAESAFFWEERNNWFSDVWTDLKGTRQGARDAARARSGAFPFELAYRLVCMFSVRGDTVLDPFLGAGTTLAAAMAAGRHGVGFEIDRSFADTIYALADTIVDFANERNRERLRKHAEFVESRTADRGEPGKTNEHYGFPVMSEQETSLLLLDLKHCALTENKVFEIEYESGPRPEAVSASMPPAFTATGEKSKQKRRAGKREPEGQISLEL